MVSRHLTSFLAPRNINLRLLNARLLSCSPTTLTKKVLEDDLDQPIPYFQSDAARWRAQVTRAGGVTDAPWFQPYVISGSLAIFMLYFFYLREESDVDLEFNKTLGERIAGIDEKQLEVVLEYNRQNNLPTKEIEEKLLEIRSKKK